MLGKKKIIASFIAISALAVVVIGGTLAYFTDKDSRTNVISIGNVKGTLTETDEKKRDDNTIGKDYSDVKPGDSLSKDPTVTLSDGSLDAYVRVKINYEGLNEEQASSIESGLDIQKDWVKATDGYYYYNKILSNKENAIKSSKVFTTVKIPVTWGNDEADITFKINASAEFIQADNFTPQKDASGNITGWGLVNIEDNKSVKQEMSSKHIDE